MSIDFSSVMRGQLEQRRDRVARAISSGGPDPQLTALLNEVDAALQRFESGTYGLCEVCHDTVEADRLISNPLERFCLDHLNICNAGHPPALLIRGGRIEPISATGLPLGMFPDQKFSIDRVKLEAGDTLLLYTDGVLETLNNTGEEYGMPRLVHITTASRSMPADRLVASCLADVTTFREGTSRFDDITMMGIRREPS